MARAWMYAIYVHVCARACTHAYKAYLGTPLWTMRETITMRVTVAIIEGISDVRFHAET